jgi:GntR family transcriptional regulator, carbon starvation induced regulator
MATFASFEEFVRAHRILAAAMIGRSRERAEAFLEAHIASTLSLVYPDSAERAS